jgi:hypothetical protein
VSKGRHPRFTKRLETTFSSSGSKYRGITSDLSAWGIFIRTHHGLMPGNVVDIEMYLPTQILCHLKGVVRRTLKTPLSTLKNGMGVELIERDRNYIEFLKSLGFESDNPEEPSPQTSTVDLREQANKKETETLRRQAENQKPGEAGHKDHEPIIVACPACKAKNRVQREILPLSPRCGKCGVLLQIG